MLKSLQLALVLFPIVSFQSYQTAQAQNTGIVIGDRIRTVNPAYLSVALDTSVVLQGEWWSKKSAPLNLKHPRFLALSRLLSQQSPTYLRIGGTDADRVIYNKTLPTQSKQILLTPQKWKTLLKFSHQLNMPLVFTSNAGPLARKHGDWQSQQTQALIDTQKTTDYKVNTWEMGNEINGYPVFFGTYVSGEQYAKDLAHFKRLFPQQRLAGPSTAWWPELKEPLSLLPEVLKKGGRHLDVLTWHYYPQQSKRCAIQSRPAQLTTLLHKNALNTGKIYATEIEKLRRRYAIQAEHWLGETGHAQCGGAPGISDRWVSSLWWLDQLGALAQVGVSVQVRQALVGSDYGLLSETDFSPRPDYWASLLWKQLMGPEVLNVKGPKNLRSYAHCHPQKGVSLLLVNPTKNLHKAYLPYPMSQGKQYRLSGQLTDKQLKLNGSLISEKKALKTGYLPSTVAHSAHISVAPYEAVFFHLPNITPKGCS